MERTGWSQKWYLLVGPAVTLGYAPGQMLEPYAAIKLIILAVFSGLAATDVVNAIHLGRINPTDFRIISYFTFIVILLLPISFAYAPIQQQLYGTSGRLTGFLQYFFLACIFLSFSLVANSKKIDGVLSSLVVTGLIESIYALIQFLGLDQVRWENPQSYIFGTLGNPNFLSSLLGLSGIVSLFRLAYSEEIKIRIFYFINLNLCLLVIVLSKSVQGGFLFSLGVFALIILISSKISLRLLFAWLGASTIAFISVILGLLKIGPLAGFLFQDSISFRGDYWRAGIAMFKSNPFFGIGLDSYGDNYRTYRDHAAASRRGLDAVSNSAHNLLIDLAATGGLLLASFIVILNIFTFALIWKKVKVEGLISTQLATLTTLWICFDVQALISINVASLAVWGTLFNAMIVGFLIESNSDKNSSGKSKRSIKFRSRVIRTQMFIVLLFVSLVLPLLSKDIAIARAIKTSNFQDITASALAWPQRCDLMLGAVKVALSNHDNRLALYISRKAVRSNVKCYSAWVAISNNSMASISEREVAHSRIRELEPNS